MKDIAEFLSIKSKTWTRDSHGLFDYESSTVKENILVIQNPILLVRRKHDVREIKQHESDPNDQFMCNVSIRENRKISIINYGRRLRTFN